MFLLYAFETGDSLADGGGERLDVSGRASNEGAEFGLHHLDEGWVLRKESGGGGFVKVLCGQTRQNVKGSLKLSSARLPHTFFQT